MNKSVKLSIPCEFVNITSINPLISRCEIKVCYVGEEPNRNGSVITKEVATEMGNTLPGSPIVGFFNEDTNDFEGHNSVIEFAGNEIRFKETTRPYGFVDLNARVWFQWFRDEDESGKFVDHEYLMTEGFLWTGQYPEAARVIQKGNNQSMELDENLSKGEWSNSDNSLGVFFIINEAVISKLCILGEDVEPCFEGAQIGMRFSLDDDFKQKVFSMIQEMTQILEKGGKPVENFEHDPALEEEEAVADPAEEQEEPVVEEGEEATPEEQLEEEGEEEAPEEPAEEPEAAPAYSLEEIPEYVELQGECATLKEQYAQASATIEQLNAELEGLRTFKANIERKEKEAMIDNFYMLSDEDKADVIEHINEYSLDDIEAKLSVICVRNKISFKEEDPSSNKGAYSYNLNSDNEEDSIPAWIQSIDNVAKNMD